MHGAIQDNASSLQQTDLAAPQTRGEKRNHPMGEKEKKATRLLKNKKVELTDVRLQKRDQKIVD